MSDYKRIVELLTEIRKLAQETEHKDSINSNVDEVLQLLPRDQNFVGENHGSLVQLRDVTGNVIV